MKLVVVEDCRHIRNGLIRLLHSHPQVELIGLAATESEAIRLIAESDPDTVLLDIGLAMGNGVRVLEAARRMGSRAYIIVMTVMAHDGYRDICLRLGANEFRDKVLDF